MSHRRTLPWLIGLVLLGIGCAKDEGPMFVPRPGPGDPNEPLDTAYFTTEVLPIFTAHCWVCHPPTAGLDLGETEAYANLVNVTSTAYAPAVRVAPGDLAGSVLWQKVTGSSDYGLTMPPTGTMLPAEDLETIRDWIEQGALEN